VFEIKFEKVPENFEKVPEKFEKVPEKFEKVPEKLSSSCEMFFSTGNGKTGKYSLLIKKKRKA
jgi:hypothetical protein